MRTSLKDRGAAAVEFALVLLPLTLLTFGIIFFGYAFHLQTMLDNAARDAVRHYTLSGENGSPAAEAAARDAVASSLDASALVGTYSIDLDIACYEDIKRITITSTKPLPLTGIFGWDVQLVGSGSMRCAD